MYPDDKPALPGLFEATKNLTTAQAAQIIKISKGYGIPTIEAASAFPTFGSYANDDVDWDGFRVRAPLSTEFLLGDPYYAKALQANIRDLETAEGTIKTWKALQNGFKGVGRNLLRFGQMVQETVQNADNTLAPINEAEVWANPAQESVRAFENPKEFIPPATTLRKLAESSLLKPKANTPNGLGEELWLGFVETAPQIAAQLLVAGATGGTSGLVAGTAFMGSQIAGGQYEKLTGDKVEPFRAMQASVADAVLQAPLEMIGLSKIFKKIPVGKTAKAYFEKATTEAVTEWLQQYPEAATEIWATRPGITPQQIASEIMNDIANFGPITQEGLKQGIIAAPFGLLGGYAANSAAKMAQRRAEANKAYLERLQELKTTSPEATAEYINHVTDGEVVYAQPDVLYQLAKGKPELLEQLGLTEQDLELAIEEGQLVEIPVGEYSVVMGNNPEAAAVLNEHVTTEENEATLTEARDRAAVKRNRRDIEKAISKVEERRIELKAAQKELYDEAVSAGMVAKEAKGFVSMFTAHSRVMAAGMGVTHAEWFRANRPVLKKADGSIAGKLLQKVKGYFQTAAWHGSPHTFDQFTTQKIGTGEGAQAYGWGMYFSSSKKIAEWYREKLAKQNTTLVIDGVNYQNGTDFYKLNDVDRLIALAYHSLGKGFRDKKSLIVQLKSNAKGAFKEWRGRFKQAIDKANTDAVDVIAESGRLYDVTLGPDESDLLDWDKPIHKQSDKIINALVDAEYNSPDFQKFTKTNPGMGTREQLESDFRYEEKTGEEWYQSLIKEKGSEEAASRYLYSIGIPGIAYEGTTSGERNYVMFDDSHVQINAMYQSYKGSIHWENGQAVISLFKSADASTGIHELLGHYMTQNLLDVGMQENAPEWMKQDRKTMLEWAGVEDWDSATKEQKVEAHEKWARAAEAYIMEGKAPSLDLRDVFRRFADWLRQIYRSVKELGVEVSPEMRGVFDRMLASEEEILQAAEVNLFMEENADLYEGLSEKERDKLNQQFDKIMERGKEILLSELIGDINTERKTVMASERERIEEEVYNELSNQPFYRMARELRKPAIRNPVEELTRQWEKKVDGLARYLRDNHGDGVENVKIYDGDINDEQAKVEKYFRVSHNAKWYQKLYEELGKKPTLADYKGLAENFLRDGFEDMSGYIDPDVEFLELEKQIAELQKTPQAIPWVTKLNTAWLKENYPDEMNTFAFMHSNLGQYDLDDVASFYRFSSADEIIWRMKNTPPLSKAVKDAVNARMNAAFPEMSREEIREAAEASMYNEESVSLLAIQLDLIREKAGQIRTAEESRKQAAQDREIAKAGAQRAISRMSVDRAMKLATWIAAERRAAEKVEKAIAKGNWSAAFEQKTIQLHNHAMVMESLKIKREFDRLNRALKKHQTSEAKTWISDEENPDGTRSKTTKHLAAASEILRRFGFERKDAPKAEEPLAQYLGRMEAQNPDMYGVAGWLVYDDKKTSIRELTIDKLRDVNNALRNIKKMARAGQNSDAFLTLNGDGLAITTNNLVDIADINVKDRQIDAPDKVDPSSLAKFFAGIRKPSKWLLELDGFKPGEWAKALYHSLADATDYKSKLVNRAVDRIEAAYKKAGIDKAQRERDAHNKIYIPEWEVSVSKNWLMAALLNMGSESNMKRLFSRNPVGITLYGPWSQETLTSVLERELDAKYFRLAQDIWDAVDMYEEYTAMIRRVTGADMKKINPQPISFNVKGETIHLRGGYYHLKADSRSSQQAELRAEQEVGDVPWISPYPNSGASKERAAAASYSVDLDLSNIYQSIQSQAHDIAFRPVALDINKLMRQNAIKEVMRRKLGDASYNAFNKWLRVNLTGKETREKGFLDDGANLFRQRAVIVNLLYRMGTVFQNLANFALYGGAVEGFGQKDALRSFMQYGVNDYIPKALSFSQAAEDIRQEVFSLSAMMRDKAQNPDYTLRDMFGRQGGFLLKSETGREIGIRLKITRENVLKFGSGMLAFGDQLSDIPMWRGAYFKALSEGKPQREAVRFADSVIENSSGTGRALDSSQLQMGSPLEKLLTMFMTFLNTQYNRWANEAGVYMKEKDHLRLLSFLGTQYILFGVLSAGLSFKWKKDDDDWSEWFVKEVLEWPLSMIPIGGGLFKYVIDRAMGFKTFNWSASPVERNIEQIANLAFNKKDTPRTIEDTMQAMSFIFGYPDQFNDWLWNLYDISSGMDPRLMDLVKRRPVRER